MALQRLKLECELLEDMHTGSGLGRRGVVDALHAKDKDGRPVVWSTTLVGLLRNEADGLMERGHSLASPERITRIFGREGADGRGALVARSLHFDGPGPHLSEIGQSAGEPGTRRPLDDSLRVIERSHAGLRATSELRLDGSDEDWRFLRICLRRLRSLGGGKTRGLGRVRITQGELEPLAPKAAADLGRRTEPGRLHVLVENLEPLCFPATASPGNILQSEGFIPGSALVGGLLWSLRAGGSEQTAGEVEKLARSGALEVTNAYPVADELLKAEEPAFRTLRVSPIPLSAERASGSRTAPSATSLPWWAGHEKRGTRWLGDATREHDRLWEAPLQHSDKDDGSKSGFKRIKDESYLASVDGASWYGATPRFATLMRNRTPVNRVGRSVDSRRNVDPTQAKLRQRQLTEDDGELFSETSLEEGQPFLLEIRLSTAEAADRFARLAGGLLAESRDQRHWIRLGRGGRPAVVTHWSWIPGSERGEAPAGIKDWDRKPAFSLTLTSDLILRGDDLLFREDLQPEDLARELGVSISGIRVEPTRSFVATREVRGFNSAAGTRRQTALALRRGSAFLITAASKPELRPLFDALCERERRGEGLGERPHEGFGRFTVNSGVHHRPPAPSGDTSGGGPDEEVSAGDREMALKQVLEVAAPTLLPALPSEVHARAAFPSRSQWQELRHLVEVTTSESELNQVLEDLVAHSEKWAGRAWRREVKTNRENILLPQWLKDSTLELKGMEARRTYVGHLCRWVAQRLANEKGAKA